MIKKRLAPFTVGVVTTIFFVLSVNAFAQTQEPAVMEQVDRHVVFAAAALNAALTRAGEDGLTSAEEARVIDWSLDFATKVVQRYP